MPHLCVLKREEGENFGFHLRLEKGLPGHVIRQVEILGAAEKSGLRDGDRLLEVNEKFVDDVDHTEVRGPKSYTAAAYVEKNIWNIVMLS